MNNPEYLRQILKYGGIKKLLPVIAFIVFLLIFTGVLEAITVPLLMLTIQALLGNGSMAGGALGKMGSIISYLHLPQGLNAMIFLVVILFVGSALLKYLNTVLMERVRFNAVKRLRENLVTTLYGTTWNMVLGLRSGDFTNVVIEKCSHFAEIYFSILQGLAAIFYSAIYMGIAILLSWRLSIVFFACFTFLYVVNSVFSIVTRRYTRLGIKYSNLFSAELFDRMRASKFIFSSNLQKDTVRLLADINKISLKNRFIEAIIVRGSTYFNELVGVLILIIALLISRRIGVGIAQLLVFVYLARQLTPRINDILRTHQAWIVNTPTALAVINYIEKFKENRQTEGVVKIERFENIHFDDVAFAYHPSFPILKGISMDVRKNSMTALVGVSGAGKTTIADLIIGLIEPQHGSIRVNDYPLSDVNKRKLHAMIGYVSQETVLFNVSLKDNIAIRKQNATDEEVGRVLKIVALDNFVASLPDGYHTQVGENGIKLSGGQRQRVALARALIISPELLILDEATSALDVESEAAIQSALEYMRDSLTIVIIAHRLSTVKSADLIYVIEDGKIVESGNYEQLVKFGGRLYEFDQTAKGKRDE